MSPRPLTFAKAWAGLLLALLVSACAGQSENSRSQVFFPPAPNLPRLQYLGGISNSSDLSGQTDSFSLFSYGRPKGSEVSYIVKPSGIASGGGKVYVSDLSGTVFVIDPPNRRMEKLAGDQGLGKLKKPVGVAVDDAGFVFVADVERREVLVYDNKGEFLKGVGIEQDMRPTDVAVDDKDLYVLDTHNAVIRVFDPVSGSLLREIGRLPEPEKSLSLPTKMSLDKKGIIRVSNAGRGDVTSYDRDGHFLGSFGKFGDGLGQFSRPKGLTADDSGHLFVVDAGFQNVQVFNDEGRLLTYFGSGKLPQGKMNLPCDITASSQALPFYQKLAAKDFELNEVLFVVNQFGSPKVGIYGLGKRKGIDYDKVYRQAAERREQKARELLKRRGEQPKQPAGDRGEPVKRAKDKEQLSRLETPPAGQ